MPGMSLRWTCEVMCCGADKQHKNSVYESGRAYAERTALAGQWRACQDIISTRSSYSIISYHTVRTLLQTYDAAPLGKLAYTVPVTSTLVARKREMEMREISYYYAQG